MNELLTQSRCLLNKDVYPVSTALRRAKGLILRRGFAGQDRLGDETQVLGRFSCQE